MRNVRVIKKADRQAAPDQHANVAVVETDAAEMQRLEMEIRRNALAVAASIARKYHLDACSTCGRAAA